MTAMTTSSLRVFERNVASYRKMWLVFVAGFTEPIFYLFSLGVGLGQLVDGVIIDGQELSYAQFVAPGLMAASAMNGAFFDMTFNFFYKLKYAKTFDAILNTPLSIGDILVGEIIWAVVRGMIYASGFLIVMTLMGLVSSWWALAAVPASLFIALAFAALGAMFSSYIRTWHDFDLIQLIIQPLFLCSTSLFPLEVYPGWAQPIVKISPLYHGVALLRDLVLGSVGLHDLWHIAFLAILGTAGALVSRRRLIQLLLK
jgi:lipooligosaccharide transport system permease protein